MTVTLAPSHYSSYTVGITVCTVLGCNVQRNNGTTSEFVGEHSREIESCCFYGFSLLSAVAASSSSRGRKLIKVNLSTRCPIAVDCHGLKMDALLARLVLLLLLGRVVTEPLYLSPNRVIVVAGLLLQPTFLFGDL